MTVTCGVLVTDGEKYLICHPTHGKWWDIPKGIKTAEEKDSAAALREMQEETGLIATESQLEYLGLFKYRPKKDLSLFLLKVATMPEIRNLRCESKFQLGNNWIPEMDDFMVVDRTTCLARVNPSMRQILRNLI